MMFIATILIVFLSNIHATIDFPSIIADSSKIGSLQQLFINSSSLSITSFKYNPTSATSDYIENIFGPKSIFLPKDTDSKKRRRKNSHQVVDDFIDIGRRKVLNSVNISTVNPKCSLELLGFGVLELDDPFTLKFRHDNPSIGIGELTLHDVENNDQQRISIEVNSCRYRGLYENWIKDSIDSSNELKSYWSTVIFCPIHDQNTCTMLNNHVEMNFNPIIPITVELQLHHSKWYGNFSTKFKSFYQEKYEIVPNIGICLPLPYVSTKPEKRVLNSAILANSIIYYLKLGIRVIVYDNQGMSYKQLIQDKYDQLVLQLDEKLLQNLVYHDYTISGLLSKDPTKVQYDNSDADYDSVVRLRKTDHDKQLTLTHCRFEAKTVFGIDTIIIADYDEFLHCPKADSTFDAQSKYISNILSVHESMNLHQLSFQQLVPANKTGSLSKCLYSQAMSFKPLFDCFSSSKYAIAFHSQKSIHLKHTCPMTGFHHACSNDLTHQLSHDCLCSGLFLFECNFIHLVTNEHKLQHDIYRYSETEKNIIRKQMSEIHLMFRRSQHIKQVLH